MLQHCAQCANVQGMESYADIVRRCFAAGYETPGYGWSLAEALKSFTSTKSIDELRIPGLSDEEADDFWHAVND